VRLIVHPDFTLPYIYNIRCIQKFVRTDYCILNVVSIFHPRRVAKNEFGAKNILDSWSLEPALRGD